MDEIRIDAEQLLSDLHKKEVRWRQKVAVAQAAAEEAELALRDYEQFKTFFSSLNRYRVPIDDTGTPGVTVTNVDETPLAGLSGMQATRTFIEMNRGREIRFSAAFEEMVKLGCDASENAINVALTSLAREGQIDRIARGVYGFPVHGLVEDVGAQRQHAVVGGADQLAIDDRGIVYFEFKEDG